MKSTMEDQINTICLKLLQHNRVNQDEVSKVIRNATIGLIQDHLNTLKDNPVKYYKPSIPPIRTLKMIGRAILYVVSLGLSFYILHAIILLYFGLAPHLTTYTCSSLITHNYVQFDFISTPSIVKGISCLGLLYTSIKRNQELITGMDRQQNITFDGVVSTIYADTKTTLYEMYQGKRNITSTQLYQDVSFIEGYIQWTVESIWYSFTHSTSDSTRTFIRWLNKKTQFIVVLRDAFIELPVIRHVRRAVKAVEDTVDHHVIRPIRETVQNGVQCLIDGFSYFGKRLIQWGKTSMIGQESMKIEMNNST